MATAVSAAKGKPETIMEKPVYSDIYEKNIFDPKRRPWAEKVVSPPSTARQPAQKPEPLPDLTELIKPPALAPEPPKLAEPSKLIDPPKQPDSTKPPKQPEPTKLSKQPEPSEPADQFGPPLPPPVPPLTTADAEIYGVMVFGDYRKALIKLGAGFKFAPQPKNKSAPRPFITLGVGESLGPYTLKEITDSSVIFESVDGLSPLVFNQRKADRPASGPISPMAQAPVILPAPVPTMVHGFEPAAQAQAAPPPAQPGAQPAAAAAATAAAAAAPVPDIATAGFEAPQPPPVQGRTLLEAIQAAQQAQKANPNAPPPVNPFAPK